MRLFIFTGFFYLTLCQSDDDSSLYFSDLQNGRAVWIVEETSLPWIGSYEYLSSLVSQKTVLLTVVDSSTGKTLGECSTMKSEKPWNRFHWVLSPDSMQCTISPLNSSRVIFPLSTNPRTFSIRIQAAHGPACLRDMFVQNERPLGCPPHLSHNSFSSIRLNCSCPFEAESMEGQEDSNEPQFPLFELTGTQITPTQNTPTWTLSPCANYHCQNNGTCVVTQEGMKNILEATCLCRNGFIGVTCEVDVCKSVPCQNNGNCRANGGEAYCECPPAFTGLLCESLSSICDPDCSNGHCVVVNGTAGCECIQGFIGPNCNVVDVCLGDAACAVFGEQAKCIPDAASYALITSTLVNATYDCHCPHPIHGQYVDCMELHFATSVSPVVQNKVSPTFPVIDMNTISNILPSSLAAKTQVPVEDKDFQKIPDAILTENQEVPLRPTSIFVHPHSSQVTFAPVLHKLITTTEKSTVHHLSSPFIFPEKVLTTQVTDNSHQTQSTAGEKNGIATEMFTTSVIENISEPFSFPTPSPMEFSKQTPFTASSSMQPANFELPSQFMTTREQSVTETIQSSLEQEMEKITEVSDIDSTSTTVAQLTTVTDAELPSVDLKESWQLTTNVDRPLTIWQTQEHEHLGMEYRPPQSTSPSFTISTQPLPKMIEENLSSETSDQSKIHQTDTSINKTVTGNVTQLENSASGRKKSSAASWIVAIVAIIVLGLLLLATTLFVLRYIKQSRKLHGKYNPAREEHALSAAYSVPMSHITKEERLI